MPQDLELEAEFERSLRDAAMECLREYRYRPTYFLSMLGQLGGKATAKALLEKPTHSSGFTKLVVDYARPDLTVEHFVTTPRFAPLFEVDEIVKANRWLGR